MTGKKIIKELEPENEKKNRTRFNIQTKTDSYLGSKFNQHSYKQISLILPISYTKKLIKSNISV